MEHVVIIGAGIGGLSAALALAARGVAVTVVERAATPGGKARAVAVDGHAIDAGPTVLTMRWVFERLFDEAGLSFDAAVATRPATILARHAWGADRLDLPASAAGQRDAIGRLAGAAEARGFDGFRAAATRTYAALLPHFIDAPATTAPGLAWRMLGGGGLAALRPFDTLATALAGHFADPRLRQLFGRYATYCGASPYAAPATLMLVAAVEMAGVWLVDGGLSALARALAAAAAARGAHIRYDAEVATIAVGRGGPTGVTLATGEHVAASHVIVNADPAALAAGRFGRAAARAVPPLAPADRSLSALVWTIAAHAHGFPLVRHNVFFGDDYPAEFAALARGRLPPDPTTYVCAQDRETGDAPPDGVERLQIIVNAPATGDRGGPSPSEIEACQAQMVTRLARSGLTLTTTSGPLTGPAGFEALFPATGGALYGRASHGWAASFRRPGPTSAIPGLYLAGGATHPGPGVPMASLSGRLAAHALLQDLASTSRSARAAMPGGMSMRSRIAAATG